MYSIGGGDWKDESYSILRPSNEEGRKFVTCGLTMEQAIEIRDELNKLIGPEKIENLNRVTTEYINSMIENGFAISSELPKTEEKENKARKLAEDLTNFFRNNGQMK